MPKLFLIWILLFPFAVHAQTPGVTQFPAGLDDSISLPVAADAKVTFLTASATNSAATFTVNSTTGFPSSGVLQMPSGELVAYTGTSSTTFTGLTRGFSGTTAQAYGANQVIKLSLSAAYVKGARGAAVELETKIGIGTSPASGASTGQCLVKQADGSTQWAACTAGSGEVNTASNVNVGGVGVFKQKSGVDLQFRGINAGSSKVTITNDSANNEIDVDLVEVNLTHDNIGGTLGVAHGGTGSSTASGARTNLGLLIGTDVEAHDSDLTTIAGLTPTTDNFMVAVSSAWASRTVAQVKATLALDNVTNTSDANKPVSTAQQTALDLKENTANKDASGGYVGLTLFKINFNNTANTFRSFFINANTVARNYTFQNRDGTIADDTDLGLKAPLASPPFTGTPTVPTAAVDTNTTQAASTAFVLGQAASATPIVDGTSAAGTSTRYARGDHVHPTDTSRAATVSPAFTGTPTAPTATANTNTTQLATTAFVLTQQGVANSPVLDGSYSYNNANESINDSTGTAITLNSEDYDDGSIHSTSSNTDRFTATTAGKYTATCSVAWDVSAVGVRILSIRLNGTTLLAAAMLLGTTLTNPYESVAVTYKLAASDYLSCYGYQTSGTALNLIQTGKLPGMSVQFISR